MGTVSLTAEKVIEARGSLSLPETATTNVYSRLSPSADQLPTIPTHASCESARGPADDSQPGLSICKCLGAMMSLTHGPGPLRCHGISGIWASKPNDMVPNARLRVLCDNAPQATVQVGVNA